MKINTWLIRQSLKLGSQLIIHILYYTVTVRQRLQIGWRRGVAIVGTLGAFACLLLFIMHPSWPTPDRLLLVLTFLFMIFNQALQMLRRLLPYVIVLLVYELFRS